jgi:ATP-dependent exoDNAse (exonuclease V) alpha subunit
MVTGPGNTGIGKGVNVGVDAYAAGIDKINSAKEKLDEARDRMEELRQNQSSMNKREVRDAEKGIRALVNQGDRDLIKGVETATGKKEADVRAAVTSAMTVRQAELDRQNRTAIAGMPGDQQRMLTTLGGKGGLEAGLAKMQELQADKTGATYAKLFTETRAEALKNGVTPPTAAEFAASLKQLAAAMNPSKVPGAVDVATPGRS